MNLDDRYEAWRKEGSAIASMLAQDLEARAPDYFDARLHLLDPDAHWNDFWTLLASNVCGSLPLGGTLLDLCCADGFWDNYCYARRCRKVVAVDMDPAAIAVATKWHAAENIEYICSDILDLPPMGEFDTVALRGALGLFEPDERQDIYAYASASLKPGGRFVGDLPVADDSNPLVGMSDYFSDMTVGVVVNPGAIIDGVMLPRQNVLWTAVK